jgi:hypothetical protein
MMGNVRKEISIDVVWIGEDLSRPQLTEEKTAVARRQADFCPVLLIPLQA